MCSYRYLAAVLLAGNAFAAGDGFMLGAGVEGDSAGGISGSLLGGAGITETTWISAAIAKSSVDLPRSQTLETLYANLDIDRSFRSLGVRAGAAYWGDPDLLDSNDWRTALYWRGNKAMLEAQYERREFDFVIPRTQLFPGRTITFDADGVGAAARFNLTEVLSLRLSGMVYDYGVEFRPTENRDIIDLISVSRLSLINSLVDHRANIKLDLNKGQRRWEFDIATSQGAVDGSRTTSMTVRFLTAVSDRMDIELGVGHDDSEAYGDVTFFSVFVYFYGAG